MFLIIQASDIPAFDNSDTIFTISSMLCSPRALLCLIVDAIRSSSGLSITDTGKHPPYLYSDKEEVLGDMVESMLTIYDLKCMKTEKIEENYKFSAYAKIKQNAL